MDQINIFDDLSRSTLRRLCQEWHLPISDDFNTLANNVQRYVAENHIILTGHNNDSVSVIDPSNVPLPDEVEPRHLPPTTKIFDKFLKIAKIQKLSFSGESDSFFSFLDDLKCIRDLFPLDDNGVLQALPFLLSGQAKTSFLLRHFNTFKEFEETFTKVYSPASKSELVKTLYQRYMGAKESPESFVNACLQINKDLGRDAIPEPSFVELLHEKLTPQYRARFRLDMPCSLSSFRNELHRIFQLLQLDRAYTAPTSEAMQHPRYGILSAIPHSSLQPISPTPFSHSPPVPT